MFTLIFIALQQVCCLPHGTKKVNFCRDKFEEKHFPSPEWSLWYFEKEAGKSWQECQHEVASCKSIEEFWILHHSIRLPSEINIGCDYALFRNPIKPMWEDERNKNGGRWVAVLNKTANWNGFNVNGMWLEIVQHFIGGSLAYAKNICGVVFNNRGKCFKIGNSRLIRLHTIHVKLNICSAF